MLRVHRAATTLLIALGLLAGAAGPASAQSAATTAAPERVEVRLSNFAFAPAELRLPAGRPIVLALVNDGSGGHDFAAPEFFAAARVDPADAGKLRRGRVEVPKGQSLTLRLVAAPGRYALKCSHFLHAGFGMTGSIIVE